MFAFTIIGFIIDGGNYLDFQFDVLADSPADAMEKAIRKDGRAVVSSVIRNPMGRGDGF